VVTIARSLLSKKRTAVDCMPASARLRKVRGRGQLRASARVSSVFAQIADPTTLDMHPAAAPRSATAASGCPGAGEELACVCADTGPNHTWPEALARFATAGGDRAERGSAATRPGRIH